jgi:hypothetical protein
MELHGPVLEACGAACTSSNATSSNGASNTGKGRASFEDHEEEEEQNEDQEKEEEEDADAYGVEGSPSISPAASLSSRPHGGGFPSSSSSSLPSRSPATSSRASSSSTDASQGRKQVTVCPSVSSVSARSHPFAALLLPASLRLLEMLAPKPIVAAPTKKHSSGSSSSSTGAIQPTLPSGLLPWHLLIADGCREGPRCSETAGPLERIAFGSSYLGQVEGLFRASIKAALCSVAFLTGRTATISNDSPFGSHGPRDSVTTVGSDMSVSRRDSGGVGAGAAASAAGAGALHVDSGASPRNSINATSSNNDPLVHGVRVLSICSPVELQSQQQSQQAQQQQSKPSNDAVITVGKSSSSSSFLVASSSSSSSSSAIGTAAGFVPMETSPFLQAPDGFSTAPEILRVRASSSSSSSSAYPPAFPPGPPSPLAMGMQPAAMPMLPMQMQMQMQPTMMAMPPAYGGAMGAWPVQQQQQQQQHHHQQQMPVLLGVAAAATTTSYTFIRGSGRDFGDDAEDEEGGHNQQQPSAVAAVAAVGGYNPLSNTNSHSYGFPPPHHPY